MLKKIFFVIGFALLAGMSHSYAQSSRDPGSVVLPQRKPAESTSQKKKSKKKRQKNHLDEAVEDYNKLMKKNAKKYARIEKGMKKPQYSDPTYFGHKKPPKKRPLGKRKMCKECGIVH